MKTLVIMPTFNEAQNLQHSVEQLFKHNPNVEVLIVDDSSPDGTGEIAETLAESSPKVHVLIRKTKDGLGPAYLAGFAWGLARNFDLLVEMDADGSHRAEDLPKLLARASENDLVIGSRWVRGGKLENWPASRVLISRIGNAYARLMLGVGIRDVTAGFRVFRASFLRKLHLENIASAGYSFQIEMALRSHQAGGRIEEVPIVFVERSLGASKMSTAIVLEAMKRVTAWGINRLLRRK